MRCRQEVQALARWFAVREWPADPVDRLRARERAAAALQRLDRLGPEAARDQIVVADGLGAYLAGVRHRRAEGRWWA